MKRQRHTITACVIIIFGTCLMVGCSDTSGADHLQAAAAAKAAATPPSQQVSMEEARKNIEDNPNIPANAKAIILSHMNGTAPNPTVH